VLPAPRLPKPLPTPPPHATSCPVPRPIKRKPLFKSSEDFMVECPWCSDAIAVPTNGVKCGIFRHGHFKKNGKQIPPHASKALCDQWSENDLMWGCGKPFQLRKDDDGRFFATQCGYV
jgi:hypothetical protein